VLTYNASDPSGLMQPALLPEDSGSFVMMPATVVVVGTVGLVVGIPVAFVAGIVTQVKESDPMGGIRCTSQITWRLNPRIHSLCLSKLNWTCSPG